MAASTGEPNEHHLDPPVPQPAIMSTEGENKNIGQVNESLQINFATHEPVQRPIDVTPTSEVFADMQDPDAPRSKRSTTAADSERSKAGILPKYFRITEPRRFAAGEKAMNQSSAEETDATTPESTISAADLTSAPEPVNQPILPTEEGGEEATPKEGGKGGAPEQDASSPEEVSMLTGSEPEQKDGVSEPLLEEREQHAFVTVERGSSNESTKWNSCRKGPDKEMWIEKGKEEVRKFEDSGAIWKIHKSEVPQLYKEGRKVEVINAFALPQTKYNAATKTEVKKVRIVADGSRQKYFDLPSTYSPTPNASTIRLVVSIAAESGLPLWHADFERAFLCSEKVNPNVVHVLRPPPGVEDEGIYWVAKHVVYGLQEAPRAFHNTVKQVLEGYGLKQAPGEQCLWFGKDNETDVHIVVQVDDLLVSSKEKWYKEFIGYLKKTGFNIKDMGQAARFMGIDVRQMPEEKTIILDQKHYAEAIVADCKLEEGRYKTTPLSFPTELTPELVAPCTEDEHAEYRRVIGAVMYLQVMTRPDLAQACSYLSQFLEAPLKWHYVKMKRMIRYLQGTADRCLVYGGPYVAPKGLSQGEMFGYVDSSWESRRSTSGFILYRNGGPIAWCSRKQKSTALSTAEAEIMAASEATKSVMAIRLILRDIGREIKGPTVLFEDNQAAIYFAQNEGTPARMKHIDVREYFVRDHVLAGDVLLAKIGSADNCADLFTKPMPKEGFSKHRDIMVTKAPKCVRTFPGEVKSPEENVSK